MRITGAGHAGEPGAPAGDLYVEVRVAEDERFERDGSDLISVVSIPATEAMLGTTVTVPTLEGEEEIEVEPGTQPGTEKVLRGAGLPRLSGGRRGSQRVMLEVFVPTNLNEEQREIAERLDESLDEENLTPQHGEGLFSRAAAGVRLIRLAVRCKPEQAELVLAELTVLAPNGVEEERGPGYVEYAIYGGEGELPELGDLDAAIAGGRVEVSATEIPDDWADRWRDFHKPLLVGDRLWLRPSWEPPRRGTRSTSSSTPARPSAPAPTRPPASASPISASWRRAASWWIWAPAPEFSRSPLRSWAGGRFAATTMSRRRSKLLRPMRRRTASIFTSSARICGNSCPNWLPLS